MLIITNIKCRLEFLKLWTVLSSRQWAVIPALRKEVEATGDPVSRHNTKPNKQKLHLTGYITIIHVKCFLPSLTWAELHPHDLHGGRKEPIPTVCPLTSAQHRTNKCKNMI